MLGVKGSNFVLEERTRYGSSSAYGCSLRLRLFTETEHTGTQRHKIVFDRGDMDRDNVSRDTELVYFVSILTGRTRKH
ncbi:hypothetical protein AHAS_Ahas15G0083700 [Arachis hypogaea]